ncbi:hypothetical protein GPECTOR_24g235 [Gonium pectorale]|uniref:Peptidase S8/S53 domain-containing protein n=1 Tax=Gonium pectorale TaxID=33097 RepID=A0A150GH43_GONPE|nr:hypothetical protein GPECTOR_24g235 [Gonium pectorale]|eukprot:KXZ48945.1 hypothetical protein GPECTOR_24g235 [Gonium pectorale]
MLLKVFNRLGYVFASNVAAAYAYALRHGAHIVVCSFGPDRANVAGPQLQQRLVEEQVYKTAVDPLSKKDVLLVAAAGNAKDESDITNLDVLVRNGSNYLPCTLSYNTTSYGNVLCVTGTDYADVVIRVNAGGNVVSGCHYGNATVQMGAPGLNISSTLPASLGLYGNKTGSSMAAPLVAGVAALVASVVGSVGVNQTAAVQANYFQARRVKELLLSAADFVPGLQVQGSRRLNATRAVRNAATNAVVPTRSPTYYITNKGDASLLAPGLAEEYTLLPPAAPGTAPADRFTAPGTFLDASMRVSTPGSPATTLRAFKYSAAMAWAVPAGWGLRLRLSGLVRFNALGVWGVALAAGDGGAALARVRLEIGEQIVNLTTPAAIDVGRLGLYEFRLTVLSPGPWLNLTWSRPGALGNFSQASEDMLLVPSYVDASYPSYAVSAANLTLGGQPSAPSSPPGWHVAWNFSTALPPPPSNLSATSAAAAFGNASLLTPGLLAAFAPGLPAAGGGPWAPLRHTALRPGLFPANTTLRGVVQAAAAASNITLPNLAAPLGVYGTAMAHLRPPANVSSLALRVTCGSCRLFVQGVLAVDASQVLPVSATAAPPRALTAQSACLPLPATTTFTQLATSTASITVTLPAVYTLELRFAVGNLSAGGVVDVAWAPCAASGLGGPTGQWAAVGPLLVSSLMWAPPSNNTYKASAVRCDAWESAGDGVVPSPLLRPPLASATLPYPNSSFAGCSRFSNDSSCSGPLQLKATDILRDKAKLDGFTTYDVRCWAFWAGAFRNGTLTMRLGFRSMDPASVLPASVYLGSQLVYRSVRGVAAAANLTRTPLAPLASAASPHRLLLAFEYSGAGAGDTLGLFDGVETASLSSYLLINQAMVVPA